MHKKVYSSHFLKTTQIFLLCHVIKMHANYAEICRVGNLEADFLQVSFVQIF